MGLYLVLATRDLRAAVSTTCSAFYMRFDRLAVVAYAGSAEELARRLDLDRTGGRGAFVGRCWVAAGLMVALVCLGVLT